MEEGWKAKLACRSSAFKVIAAEPQPSYCDNWQEPLLLGAHGWSLNRTLQGIIQRAAELVISHLPCCSFVVVTVFILKNPSLKLYRKKKKNPVLKTETSN